MRVAADGGAEVEHHRIAARRGPYRSQRRPVDSGQHAEAEPGHRRQRTGIGRLRFATSASPFLTASMASHIEEVLRPRRSAWLGLSCMLTATSVWMTRDTAFSAACWRAAVRSARDRRTAGIRSRGCRVSEMAAPGMTTDAPTSPPMASARCRTFCGMNVPETLIFCGSQSRLRPRTGNRHGWRRSARPQHCTPAGPRQ